MRLFMGLMLALITVTGWAEGSCKPQRRAMHEQRRQHRDCNKAWQDSMRGNAPDPADDCVAKQTAYVDAMKAYKACLRDSKIVK